MNKLRFSLHLSLLLGASQMLAVPANPAPGKLTQPDGTEITVRLHGDEFHNYLTTIDNYTLMRDADGRWCYAVTAADGTLIPGTVAAKDAVFRSSEDTEYLKSIVPGLTGMPTHAQLQLRAGASELVSVSNQRRLYDYNKFKGLVILVSFNDRSFTQSDINQVFNGIINQRDYDGFTPAGSSAKQIYTGSVRDYFYDNSSGKFSPEFDVVGPVSVPYSQYYINQTENARTVINAAIQQLDKDIDFSKYDTDGDGVVDMFYVIFAGFGSNNSGNDQRLVWPHAYTMAGNIYDGVRLGRYARSTELYGTFMSNCIDGIGTICHEFSHVLGLMDEYDTDYSGSGGQSVDPGLWSVMAGGSYNNFSRTPVGYSLMQRYQSGFAVPETITGAGEYTLADIDASNAGYRINTSNPKEYFLLENRRRNKWNRYIPGEGMLIFRVDSTSTIPWSQNTINADPEHNYYELVRACPKGSGLAITDSDGDPFPGSGGVTAVGPFTSPGLVSWGDRYEVALQLEEITEDEQGLISFRTRLAAGGDDCEDFEAMTTEGKADKNVPGKYCSWSFTNGGVYSPGMEYCNGSRAAGVLKGGAIETSPVDDVTAISMRVFNSATRSYNVRLQYFDSAINGWIILKDNNGLSGNTIDANTNTTLRFDVPEEIRKGLQLQLKVITGSDTEPLYIDDVQMMGVSAGVTGVTSDTPSTLRVSLEPGGMLTAFTSAREVRVYDFSGRLILSAPVSGGRTTLPLPTRGIYIVTDGTAAVKIAF